MKYKIVILFSLLIGSNLFAQKHKEPINYVNTFIGTGIYGNTFPGAQSPYGMISVSPNTTFDDYDSVDARAGYKYTRDEIYGFSLTHFSGVGCHAMQDLPFLPLTGDLNTSPVNNKNAYYSKFSHENEKASPGFYSVYLDDYKTKFKVTSKLRSAIAEIEYEKGEDAHLILAPTNNANNISAGQINIDPSKNRITGYAASGGFCWRDPADRPYNVYFVMQFDEPFDNYGYWKGQQKHERELSIDGTDIAAFISFSKKESLDVNVRIGISYVSVNNAILNLAEEIGDEEFEEVLQEVQTHWSSYLNRIVVDGDSETEKTKFYTAIYHNLLQANIFEDVNGEYLGFDDEVHHIESGRNKFVNFSLWDTYRTTAYLQAILSPKEASDMVHSLLLDAEQGGSFPNWSMNNQEFGVMNGYSVFPFIANIYAFGGRDFDLNAVKDMMKKVSMERYTCRGHHGWMNIEEYKELGYVPIEANGHGSSMTLEYGIDDYSIAKICEAAGDIEAANYYYKRSQNPFNLFNPMNNLIQAKHRDGTFIKDFSKSSEVGFNEGNASQYFWSVPHSISKLIEKAGGKEEVSKKLDDFMSRKEVGWAPDKPYFWLGNEPCFGSSYVYNFLQQPWKTQLHVNDVTVNYFNVSPDGLPGDDDSGAMSALYAFGAMGLYPYLPGTDGLTISGPIFERITFNLPNGKMIDIKANNASKENPYIKDMTVNGKSHSKLWLNWTDLPNETEITFEMTDKQTTWGSNENDIPVNYQMK